MTKSVKKSPHPKEKELVASSQTITHSYQGAVPPPYILKGIDEIVPGAASRIIDLAEQESLHRRAIDQKAIDANINAQKSQIRLNNKQTNFVLVSDLFGQFCGWVVCLACIAAATYAGIQGHEWLEGAIAAIPTAALIKSFLFSKKK